MDEKQKSVENNDWAITGELDKTRAQLLGKLPGRWGRMTPMSRLMIFEVGSILQRNGIISSHCMRVDESSTIGIVGATSRGCLHTDEAFLATMNLGPGLASPALFGYTLPNIVLAEAATHYGLVGPVYALIDEVQPLAMAAQEAQLLLDAQEGLDRMIACEFDHYSHQDGSATFDVKLKLIQ